jgi:cytochrome c
MDSRPVAPLVLALMLLGIVPTMSHAQDANEGERLFRQRCASCHALDAKQTRAGPHLDGIIGRRAGSVEKARYSRAMQDAQIIWDDQSLDNFLANPRRAIAGTSMMVGVPNADQRKAIIAYLQTLPGTAQ